MRDLEEGKAIGLLSELLDVWSGSAVAVAMTMAAEQLFGTLGPTRRLTGGKIGDDERVARNDDQRARRRRTGGRQTRGREK